MPEPEAMIKPIESKRPTGVTALAFLSIIIGCFNSVVFLFFDSLLAPWHNLVLMGILRSNLVLTGIALFVLAYGFLGGKSWALPVGWYFGVWLIFVGDIVGDVTWDIVLLDILGIWDIAGIICAGLILYYLTRSHVEGFFRHSSKS